MKAQNNLYGEAMALDNMARMYENISNNQKAYETLQAVSFHIIVCTCLSIQSCVCVFVWYGENRILNKTTKN